MTNEAETITSIVIKCASDVFDTPREDISEKSVIATDLHGDSFDHIEFVMLLEEAFGIEFSDDDVEEIKTISDAVNRVSETLSREEIAA